MRRFRLGIAGRIIPWPGWNYKLEMDLTDGENTVKDLNYQLKQLCYRNRDGSYATQANRLHQLMLIANQLVVLGFRGMNPRSLKPKHIDALVKEWLQQELGISEETLAAYFNEGVIA